MREFDLSFKQEIIGVDEAGRGPLAGPVVAAAVYIKKYDNSLLGINDSKKLSEKKRKELYEKITNNENIIYSVAVIDEKIIDEINILNATLKAMKDAIFNLNLELENYLFLIDGNKKIKDFIFNQETIVKGDAKSLSIAAASIIAKVFRDEIMKDYSLIYPEYCFEKHKGYGTKLHYEKIKEYGITKIHRRTFLKNIKEGVDYEEKM